MAAATVAMDSINEGSESIDRYVRGVSHSPSVADHTPPAQCVDALPTATNPKSHTSMHVRLWPDGWHTTSPWAGADGRLHVVVVATGSARVVCTTTHATTITSSATRRAVARHMVGV